MQLAYVIATLIWLICCTDDDDSCAAELAAAGPSRARQEDLGEGQVTAMSTPWTCRLELIARGGAPMPTYRTVIVQAWNHESAVHEAWRIHGSEYESVYVVSVLWCREGVFPDLCASPSEASDTEACVGVCGPLPAPGPAPGPEH